MPDYKKGKIYCIRSYETDEIYIGSTIERLARRMAGHRAKYKRFLQGKHKRYTTSFKILEHKDAYIELIINCPCNNKEELHRTEGKYIRERDCVNRCVAGRTQKQYKHDHKERIALYQKTYNQTNKEKRNIYRKHNKTKIQQQTKAYRERNKDKIKSYRETNKEKIQKYKHEYRQKIFICECGSTMKQDGKWRHFKTKKHQKYIASLNDEKNNN